jgi:very-short-patch-repair endonuclease
LEKILPKRLTTEQFIEKAERVHGNKYDYSFVEYKNNKTKVKIVCPIHGEFYQLPINHLNGLVCPKCNNKKQRHTRESFIEKAKDVHGDKYDYSFIKYKGIYPKVRIMCPEHGEFWQIPNNHLQGSICPKCALNRTFTIEEFIEKAKNVHGNIYDYSNTKYVNIDTKVDIICATHGAFWQTPYQHVNLKQGCPICRESHGEKKIRTFLEENNIGYVPQKYFDDLKYINHLRYDFYLPDYNLLVEFDGQQHFEDSTLYSSEDIFLRDKLKNKYARENGYDLLRIPYWKVDEVEELLLKFF